MFLQTNGQILIGGNFNEFNAVSQNYVARLNADGSLDNSFYVGQGPAGGGPANYTKAVAGQTNGMVLLGNNFAFFDGISIAGALVRFRSDGRVSNLTFTNDVVGPVTAIVPLPNGGFLLQGVTYRSTNGTSLNNLVRLNGDASLDPGFRQATLIGGNGAVQVVAVQANGSVLIGGSFLNVTGGQALQFVARLNPERVGRPQVRRPGLDQR